VSIRTGPSPRGYSRVWEFQRCEQLWDYETNGVPELGVGPLAAPTCHDYIAIGTCFHEAMRARNRGGSFEDSVVAASEALDFLCATYNNLAPDAAKLRDFLCELISQYALKFGDNRELDPYILPDGTKLVEQQFDIILPDQQLLTARVDLVCFWQGVPTVVDYKTTADDLAYYFQQFDMDSKCTAYVYGAKQRFGFEHVNVAIIAARKPRKNPKTKEWPEPLKFDFDVHITQRSPRELERWADKTMSLLKQMNEVTQRRRLPIQDDQQCLDKYRKICVYKPLCKYGLRQEVVSQFKTGVNIEMEGE